MRVSDLNFRHLLYFWTVAREGSVTRAASKLHVTQPTISAQLRELEESLGAKLLRREGRGVAPTETGRLVAQYADEIFDLGQELIDAIGETNAGPRTPLVVGVADVVPKIVAHRLLDPLLHVEDGPPIRLTCLVGHPDELYHRLAAHELDLVISDSPVSESLPFKAYHQALGECGVSFFGAESLRADLGPFPGCLDGAPVLLPTRNTVLRRALEHWFDAQDVRPHVVAEFEDATYLKVFGQEGLGLFPAPTLIAEELVQQFDVQVVGEASEVVERFYAVRTERRFRHPALERLPDVFLRDA